MPYSMIFYIPHLCFNLGGFLQTWWRMDLEKNWQILDKVAQLIIDPAFANTYLPETQPIKFSHKTNCFLDMKYHC